nr:hypothetical protein CFP56_51001 [Quercus suber]
MVTEINEAIENVVMDDRATILNPLPGFVVNYRDHNNIILTTFVPWIYFFKELDSIIIKEQYEPPVKEIRVEGIREDIKIDIGSIQSFEDFIRTLQLLWSSYTNKIPEDYFCSSMPWEVPGDDTRAERVVGAGAEISNPEDFTDSATSDANSRMVDVDHEDFSQWAVEFVDLWTKVKRRIERIVMVQF